PGLAERRAPGRAQGAARRRSRASRGARRRGRHHPDERSRMNGTWLDFEKPIIELERKIEELKSRAGGDERETAEELDRLEKKADRLRKDIFSKLTRWQRVKLARHPRRPYTLDYLKILAPQFMELHGDRRFADDPAIVGGLGMLDELPVLFLGHQKGR